MWLNNMTITNTLWPIRIDRTNPGGQKLSCASFKTCKASQPYIFKHTTPGGDVAHSEDSPIRPFCWIWLARVISRQWRESKPQIFLDKAVINYATGSLNILAIKVSSLRLEEREAIGRFLGAVRELKSELLSTAKNIRQFQTQYLKLDQKKNTALLHFLL